MKEGWLLEDHYLAKPRSFLLSRNMATILFSHFVVALMAFSHTCHLLSIPNLKFSTNENNSLISVFIKSGKLVSFRVYNSFINTNHGKHIGLDRHLQNQGQEGMPYEHMCFVCNQDCHPFHGK